MANGSGIIVLIFGTLVLGGLGLYYVTKKKGPTASDFLVPVPTTTGVSGVSGTSFDYGTVAFNPSNQIFVPTTFTESPGVPIIGGRTPYRRIPTGTCKCNDMACCYESIYQPQIGHAYSKKTCADINWGDPVDACQRAVEQFDAEIYGSDNTYNPDYYHRRYYGSHRARRFSGRVSKLTSARRS